MPLTESFIQAAIWASIMLTIAGIAVLVIARTTQAAIAAMARAAGQAVAHAEGRQRSQPQARPQLVTEGRATLLIPDGAVLVKLVRKAGLEAEGGPEKPLSDLAAALVACGIEPAHVVEATAAGPDGSMVLSFLQKGPGELPSEVKQAALSFGFREPNGRERPPYAPVDAQAMLGRKATERAVANVESLRERLAIKQDLEIVSAEMATEIPGDMDGLVVMAARVIWRQSGTAAA